MTDVVVLLAPRLQFLRAPVSLCCRSRLKPSVAAIFSDVIPITHLLYCSNFSVHDIPLSQISVAVLQCIHCHSVEADVFHGTADQAVNKVISIKPNFLANAILKVDTAAGHLPSHLEIVHSAAVEP